MRERARVPVARFVRPQPMPRPGETITGTFRCEMCGSRPSEIAIEGGPDGLLVSRCPGSATGDHYMTWRHEACPACCAYPCGCGQDGAA